MNEIVEIAGVGMHPFGRFPQKSLKDLARTAVVRALTDAGIGPAGVDAVYSANAMAGVLQGQEQIRGQSVLRDVGLERVPVVNIENACASGSSALHQAILGLRSGAYGTALVVGFEKMFVDDRDRTLGALESAADLDIVSGLGLQFTAIYAMRLRRWLDAGLISMKHLVAITVKSHYNGSLNPYAQHRKVFTPEEVLQSRPIADPLTLLMCSSISDGAAAVVLRRSGADRLADRPQVTVRASSAASGYTSVPGQMSTAALCAQAAYAGAGVDPLDIDIVEVHDAMAPGEILYYEQLGFCDAEHAAELVESDATGLRGRLPVNPSGGLCSRGHPIGATGVAQIVELTWQLRGEAGDRQAGRPRLALAQNSGGWLQGEPAACNVHILERTQAWT
jgi:acetyl-CoA acetyltransferase